MLGAEPHVGVGGQMEDEVAALHRRREGGQVEIVAADQRNRGSAAAPSRNCSWPVEKLSHPTTRQSTGEQPVDQVGADESGRAGHENTLHEAEEKGG